MVNSATKAQDNLALRLTISLLSIGLFAFWVVTGWAGIESFSAFRSEIRTGAPVIRAPGYYGLFCLFIILAWPSLRAIWLLSMRLRGRVPWMYTKFRRDAAKAPKYIVGYMYLLPIFFVCFMKVVVHADNRFTASMASYCYSDCFQGKGKDTVVYFVLSSVIRKSGCPGGMTSSPQLYHNFD